MGNPSECYLVVEDERAEKCYRMAVAVARKHGTVKREKKHRYEAVIGHMVYYLELKYDIYDYGYQRVKIPTILPTIMLRSVATLHEDELKPFFDMCFDMCNEIDPLFACGGNEIAVGDGPATTSLEHHRNPYFFCLEPLDDPSYTAGFLYDEAMLKKVSEIAKVWPRDELIELLRTCCGRVGVGPYGGVTVVKGDDSDLIERVRFIMPREVRKRGVDLAEGIIEKYAKESEIWRCKKFVPVFGDLDSFCEVGRVVELHFTRPHETASPIDGSVSVDLNDRAKGTQVSAECFLGGYAELEKWEKIAKGESVSLRLVLINWRYDSAQSVSSREKVISYLGSRTYSMQGEILKLENHPRYEDSLAVMLDCGVYIETRIVKNHGLKVGDYISVEGRLDAHIVGKVS
ncbi:hypothetical protein HYU15_01790 [Candidatus Woesearchaeota archaeon]|nr:hypothetical protein [Candidatus Woesearchaeota archaeon]